LTWDVRPVQDAVACISDLCTATTPIGIMFAAADGIYLYRGGRAVNIMDGRTRKEWRALIAAGATPVGGGYLGSNQYVVWLSSGNGYQCNIDRDAFRWNQIQSVTPHTNLAPDPTRPPATYAGAYGAGAGSTTTKVLRAEKMLEVTTGLDALGSNPNPQLTTRSYTENDVAQLRQWKAVEVVVRLKPAGVTMNVTALPGVDAEESSTLLGTITGSASGAAQFKRFSLVPRINSKALAIDIVVASGTIDEFEMISLKLDSEPLNEKRAV
jgi:hypothetical protein